MSSQHSFWAALRDDQGLLMDGALNTELNLRGYQFNTNEWLRANLDNPQAIAEIHKAYADAGARVHIANSFSGARYVLEAAGLGSDYEAINRAAVALCREAVGSDGDQWIAGSVSTFAPDHDRRKLPPPERLEAYSREQAELLADAGCDLIALEMLIEPESSLAMIKGVAATGLPFSVGLVCALDDGGEVVLEGSRDIRHSIPNVSLASVLPDIIDAMGRENQALLTVMHSQVEDTGPALELIASQWQGPLGAYPNLGRYKAPGGWDVSDAVDPGTFVTMAQSWRNSGVRLLGGCCGVGPAYITALAGEF